MKPSILLILLLPLCSWAQITYPSARRCDQVDDYFGKKVPDPYRWLECPDSAETAAWLQQENELTETYLAKIPYRAQWRKELDKTLRYKSISAPLLKNGWYYYFQHDERKVHDILCRQASLDSTSPVIVVLDPNELTRDETTNLGEIKFSHSGEYCTYTLYDKGSDWGTVHVMDLKTLQPLKDELHGTKHTAIAWQGSGFYYSRFPQVDDNNKMISRNVNEKIYYHHIGTDQSADKLIYQDTARSLRYYTVRTSEDERYLFLSITNHAMGWGGNAYYYKSRSDHELKPIQASMARGGYSYIATTGKYFLLNVNGAIMRYDTVTRDMVEIITPRDPISSIKYAGGKIFITYLKDVHNLVTVYDTRGRKEKDIELPELGTVYGFTGAEAATEVFYTFSSYTTPPRIYRYDIPTRTSTLVQEMKIDHDLTQYVTEQVFYTTTDGDEVPMFIIHKKGLVQDGSHPTLLYAYGGFGVSVLPDFQPALLPFLDAGGVYASASIRGGGEYGGRWYAAGIQDNKQNSFDDFAEAAKYLIRKKYTDRDHLAIRGASNGGVLIGAVCNQHPELFKVAIAEVGVMDMLRYQHFTVGLVWKTEYGSSDNEHEFENIYRYSPLHNINPHKKYPAMLITTADHDDRVVPAHSYKYAATLQQEVGAQNPDPILLRVEHDSGHGSSTPAKYLDRLADIYSFIFWNMGLTPVFQN
ncbi:MAG: S9 family peptidase [Bacteroidetes bacterium]|nr:S9 family peptidase [Bacteroidota bacterium]